MQLINLPTLTLALSSAGFAFASSAFVAKDLYLTEIAPAQLQRLSEFTNLHKATLTAPQAAFLSKAAVAVTTYDTASADQLRAEAESLFTVEEVRYIGTGKVATRTARRGDAGLQARASCTCSSADSWCTNNTACKAGQNGCSQIGGCGWLGLYTCDGLCVNV
jgi:hypothetical protein